MADDKGNVAGSAPGLRTLAMVNVALRIVALVALVFVIQRAPSARGMFVILAGGMAVSLSLLSRLGRR